MEAIPCNANGEDRDSEERGVALNGRLE